MHPEIGPEFMDKTRHALLGPSDQMKGLPQPALEVESPQQAGRIELPPPSKADFGAVPLPQAIENRRSVRDYAPQPLTLAELSFLLWCTQGVKQVHRGAATFRTVPSAGARHAFETFLLINRVGGLQSGLYRFLAIEHALLPLSAAEDVADRLTAACLGQRFVKTGAATFIWAADVYRMTWRYGQRGYRYLHLDAGHVCQNLYLAAEAVGAGVCAIAAFDDDALNALLDLDGREQLAIYLATVGKRST